MPRKHSHHYLFNNQSAVWGYANCGTKICKKYLKPKSGLSIIAIIIGCSLISSTSRAETIRSAMASAYIGNPTLNAQRAATRVTDEGVPLARSGYLPKISGNADYGLSRAVYKYSGTRSTTELKPRGFGVTISQTLFDGLTTVNNVRSAKAAVKAAQQNLRNSEQNVLFDAASSYMNVLRDTSVTSYRGQNLAFLNEEVRAAKERFNVGESTRTDVAQAQASRASAVAALASARAQLKGSIAVYRQIVGHDPKNQQTAHNIDNLLPREINAALAIARREHPAILATHHLVDQASFNVKSAEGGLLPSLSVSGSASKRVDVSLAGDRNVSNSVYATLAVPIYQGGAVSAKIRQNKELLGQRRIEVDSIVDQVRAAVIFAFSQLESARHSVTSGVAQLRASRLALEGIVEERNVGQRTTLDVLTTQQSVLSAQITLAGARRDSIVAGYSLLSAIGRLDARRMKLKVAIYEPEEHYQAVKDKWFGLRTPDNR
ncbi:MAG: TolC family outer membrane protein [Hyphomicrobiales bacterium]|nr:TolC family outer membrane protein [Hyphomicrobiales bacterium]